MCIRDRLKLRPNKYINIQNIENQLIKLINILHPNVIYQYLI